MTFAADIPKHSRLNYRSATMIQYEYHGQLVAEYGTLE